MKIFLLKVIILSSFIMFNCLAQQPGWEVISSGTTEDLNSIYFYDYQTGYACGNSGVVIKSVDSGKTWQALQSPVSQSLNDLFVSDHDCLIAVGDSSTIVITSDGGETWYSETHHLGLDENLYCVSYSENQNVFGGVFGGESQTIFVSGSVYCAIVTYAYQSGADGHNLLSAHMLTDQIGYAAGVNSLFQPFFGKTTDSGVSWEFVSFYLNGNEGKATGVDFTDQLTGYVSARVWDGRGAISKTLDNGNNWITTFFPNPLWGIDFPISGASQVGYCVGDSGTILKTYNAGENWQTQQSGTSLRLNKVHFIDLDFGFAVGENGTILRTTTGGGLITQVKEKSSLVYEFNLEQNYPNPFNPATKIKYQIPELNLITIKVYDVLGNEVATLLNEEKTQGFYTIEFEASKLTSGVYFYQLRAGNFIETKKMLLLK